MGYPKIAAYCGQRSSGFPLVDGAGRLDEAMCAMLARYPMVTLDVNMALERPDVVHALRRINSSIIVLGYMTITHWWLAPEFVPRPDDKTFNARWHKALVETQGFVPRAPLGYEVDWSRYDTVRALSELVFDAYGRRLFDGAFFDYLSPLVSWAGIGDRNSDSVRLGNLRELVMNMRSRFHSNLRFRVYGNGTGAEMLQLDGVMLEGFPNALTTLDMALKNLRPGDWLKAEGSGSGDPRVARLVAATACMTGATACYGTDHRVALPYEGTWWFDHYSVRPVYGTSGGWPDAGNPGNLEWLGHPLGPMFKAEARLDSVAPVTVSGEVLMRRFDRGAVILNPNGSAATVNMGLAWHRRIGGNERESVLFTIPAGDAAFVLTVRPPSLGWED